MIEIICENCNKKFEIKNYRKKTAKYCSIKCRQERLKKKFKGGKNPFQGKHHSEETKQKISIANKGNVSYIRTNKYKKEMSKIKKDFYKNHPEYKDKLSERMMKNNPMSNPINIKKLSLSLKGHIPWNKGISRTKVEKEKISNTRKQRIKEGKIKISEETRKKISKANKGKKKHSEEFKKKQSEKMKKNNPMKNSETIKKHIETCRINGVYDRLSKRFKTNNPTKNPETIKKIIDANSGEKAHNWQGGKSFEPYSPEFNKQLKEKMRKRDNYRCQQCFRHQDELTKNTKTGLKPCKLHIHHIDYNKQNNNPENLVSLCSSCHAQTGFNRNDWTKYFQGKVK